MNFRAHRDWYYDGKGYYPYILINGKFEIVDFLIEQLPRYGLTCSHHGESHKPAANGLQYDWFLRVFTTNHERPSITKVKEFLETVLPEWTQLQENQRILADENLRQRLKDLEARQPEFEQAIKDAENWESIAREEHKKAQEWQKLAEDYDKASKDTDEKYQQLQQKYESLKLAYEQLQQSIEIEPNGQELSNEDDENSLKTILDCVFPQVELMDDSVDVMQHSISQRVYLRELRAIVYGKVPGTKVREAPDWSERRFNTGTTHGSAGRVYFRKLGEEKYQILMSLKQQQDDDFRRLKLL